MGANGSKNPPPSPYRWIVLGTFMATSIVAQMLWLTFSSLPPCGTAVLCATADNVTLLTAIYPLVFVVISIPTGMFIDLKGFRPSVLLGAVLLAVSGALRPFSTSFPLLLAIQGVGAVGQPFILNSISKLVRTWFPASEVATATGLGTLSIYIGLALGFGLTPVLAATWGTLGMFEAYGAFAVLAFVLFALAGREGPHPGAAGETTSLRAIFGMLRIRNVALLSALFFAGIGVFNSFATYVQPMLGARGVSADTAGELGGIMIIGGIAGALVISLIADRYHTLRRPLWVCVAVAVGLWALLGIGYGVVEESIVLLALGFFFMAALPLGLELSARSVSASAEGAANAVVWEFSQIGGTIMIFSFDAVGLSMGWTVTFFLAAGISLAMLAAGLLLRTE